MATILLRRGTSTEWAAKNPILAAGELGVDTTQSKIKLGDGITAWNSLDYITSGGGGGGGNSWGSITGTLSSQTDLQTALNGKQPLTTVLTNTTASFTTAQETKLAGIESGATANQTNSFLLDRANHTGTQAISTVTGLQTAIDAKQDALVSGTNIKTVNGTSILGSGNIVAGGSVTMQSATLDFGSLSYNAKVSVSDAAVTSSTRVVYGLTVSGREADELEMAPIVLSHVVNDGVGIDFYAYALQGADGQFTINYTKA
jgi:hypothetical protein